MKRLLPLSLLIGCLSAQSASASNDILTCTFPFSNPPTRLELHLASTPPVSHRRDAQVFVDTGGAQMIEARAHYVPARISEIGVSYGEVVVPKTEQTFLVMRIAANGDLLGREFETRTQKPLSEPAFGRCDDGMKIFSLWK